MKHIKQLVIDIDKKNNETVQSVQYDTNTRFIHINLVSNSIPFDITGCSVKISGTKPDGTAIFNNCTVVNAKEGFVEVELTEQINAVEGLVKCELKLYNGTGVLTTKQFNIYVTASVTSKTITSSNEFKALTEALDKVQSIDDRFESLTEEAVKEATAVEIQKQIEAGTMANLTIGDGTITKEKLDPNLKFGIEDGEVTNEKISPGAITLDKLNDSVYEGSVLKSLDFTCKEGNSYKPYFYYNFVFDTQDIINLTPDIPITYEYVFNTTDDNIKTMGVWIGNPAGSTGYTPNWYDIKDIENIELGNRYKISNTVNSKTETNRYINLMFKMTFKDPTKLSKFSTSYPKVYIQNKELPLVYKGTITTVEGLIVNDNEITFESLAKYSQLAKIEKRIEYFEEGGLIDKSIKLSHLSDEISMPLNQILIHTTQTSKSTEYIESVFDLAVYDLVDKELDLECEWQILDTSLTLTSSSVWCGVSEKNTSNGFGGNIINCPNFNIKDNGYIDGSFKSDGALSKQGKYLHILIANNKTTGISFDYIVKKLKVKVKGQYLTPSWRYIHGTDVTSTIAFEEYSPEQLISFKNVDMIVNRIPTPQHYDGHIRTFGDSITSGGYPKHIGNILKCKITNHGSSGSNTNRLRDIIMGTDTYTKPDYSNTTAVTIMIGHNEGITGSLDDYTLEEGQTFLDYPTTGYGNIGKSIEFIQQENPNIKIYMCTLHKTDRLGAGENENGTSKVASEKIKEIARHYGLPLIDVYSECGIGWHNYKKYASDGTHPNEAGHKLIGEYIGYQMLVK